ncbi:MAG: four helix bundle protein [Bacteroidaceae bacterium]|nr:four helix bundle protein [Bacteroidaceae bacterium]
MRDFKKFTFWYDALQLSADICVITRKFPIEERFGLANQLRRAAISIVSNIAEGSGRNSDMDFVHFLDMALGSSYEVEAQLYISERLRYITADEMKVLLNNLFSVQRRISGFIKNIRGIQ